MPRTREEILEQRRQSKAEYGQLFDSIAALLLLHDPIGINFEVNPDEYEPETGTILPRLRECQSAGDVLRGPVGSTAVRRLIESYQPVLGIHGHIHESGGERKIGKTVCVNPGSEANHGVLRGYIVDIGKKGVDLVQRVEG